MKLIDILRDADEERPNAFSDGRKTKWVNELETTIRAEVMGETPERAEHILESEWRGEGIAFPDGATCIVPGRFEVRAGGRVDVTGLTDYGGNEGRALPVLAAEVGAEETVLTFAAGTFDVTGTAPESGTARLTYDGSEEALLAPDGWEKIYVSYLVARIDAANTEYNVYANSLQLHNEFFGEFCRWYARTYIDNLD